MTLPVELPDDSEYSLSVQLTIFGLTESLSKPCPQQAVFHNVNFECL